MQVEEQQARTRQRQGRWSAVALAWFCAVAQGCSPRSNAADAAGAADAVTDAAFDVGGDSLDTVEVVANEVGDALKAEVGEGLEPEVVDSLEVLDAIADVSGGDGEPDLDLGPADVEPPLDATAVDAGSACTSTDIPDALTGTVEFQAAAYVYNPVVMGCGKGEPKSVKTGMPCCDCPPPYSCYCNGECGWLRAPDLVKPQNNGQAVWTGKWAVSLGEAGQQYKSPSSMNLQKWQPGSGKGFELVPLPTSPGFPIGNAVVMLFGGKVLVGVSCCQGGAITYTPTDPMYLYDPDTDVFTAITMPFCGKLLLSGGTLVCVAAWQGGPPLYPGGVHFYNSVAGTWAVAPTPINVAGKNWSITSPERTVANENAVYSVGAVVSGGPWPDGTPGWPGPQHILKYAIDTQQWADIGVVPADWQDGTTFLDPVGIVRVKNGIQAARFRLDTFKWEVGPKFLYSRFGSQAPTLTPCGILFGSGTLNTVSGGGGMAYRPVVLALDLSWKVLSPWGYPNDATTSRKGPNIVLTDKEVFALGGFDGPPQGNFVYHNDSYRYPLSALCNNGGSK